MPKRKKGDADAGSSKEAKTDDDKLEKTYILVYCENLDSSTSIETYDSKNKLMTELKSFIKDNIEPLYLDREEELGEDMNDLKDWTLEKTLSFVKSHGRDPFTMNEDGRLYRVWTLEAIIEGNDIVVHTQ